MGNLRLEKRGILFWDLAGKAFSIVPRSPFRVPTLECFALRLLILLALIVVAWPGFLWSQDDRSNSGPGLTASLDRDSALVGELVELTLRYELPEGARLPEDSEISGIEGLAVIQRVAEPGQIKIEFLVDRLGPWESGPLSLVYLDIDDKSQVLKADPVQLRVLSNLGDKPEEAQLRPIQGIVSAQAVWLQYLGWGGGLLALLLGGAGFLWWRKKRRVQRQFSEIEDPPHIRARKGIEQLQAKGIFEEGHFKEFYFLFTEILRRYLESLRGFPAAEFTTEEIARYVTYEPDRKLVPLLREADLVKFADAVPTSARRDEDVESALSYIRETSPTSADGQATEVSYKVLE
jgi:hypothetical protein